MKYIFRKFNPVERMIMSRDSGLLNEYFAITKGQLIDLYYFAICDKDIDENDPNNPNYQKVSVTTV